MWTITRTCTSNTCGDSWRRCLGCSTAIFAPMVGPSTTVVAIEGGPDLTTGRSTVAG